MQFQQMQKSAFDIMETLVLRILSGYDHNIVAAFDAMLIQSVTFPDKPAESMSYNAVPHLLADGNPQTVMIQSVFPDIHDQQTIGKRPALLINLLKFPGVLQRYDMFHVPHFPSKE